MTATNQTSNGNGSTRTPEERAELEKRQDVAASAEMAEQHTQEANIGRLAAMKAFFDTEASRERGRKIQKRKFNAALDKALDEENPDTSELRSLCLKAVRAKRQGLLDQFDE